MCILLLFSINTFTTFASSCSFADWNIGSRSNKLHVHLETRSESALLKPSSSLSPSLPPSSKSHNVICINCIQVSLKMENHQTMAKKRWPTKGELEVNNNALCCLLSFILSHIFYSFHYFFNEHQSFIAPSTIHLLYSLHCRYFIHFFCSGTKQTATIIIVNYVFLESSHFQNQNCRKMRVTVKGFGKKSK